MFISIQMHKWYSDIFNTKPRVRTQFTVSYNVCLLLVFFLLFYCTQNVDLLWLRASSVRVKRSPKRTASIVSMLNACAHNNDWRSTALLPDLLLCEVLCEDNFFLEFFKKQFGFYVQILRFRGYNISLLKHLSIQNDTSTASASQNGNWTHFRSFEPSIQRIWSKTNLKASWKIGDF